MKIICTAILIALLSSGIRATEDVISIDIEHDQLEGLGVKIVASSIYSAVFGGGYRIHFLGEQLDGETEIYEILIEMTLEDGIAVLPIEVSWNDSGIYLSGDLMVTSELLSKITVVFNERLKAGTTLGRKYRLDLGKAITEAPSGSSGQ